MAGQGGVFQRRAGGNKGLYCHFIRHNNLVLHPDIDAFKHSLLYFRGNKGKQGQKGHMGIKIMKKGIEYF